MKLHTFLASIALVLVTTFVYTEACSCMPSHPQEHYCASDFVILARVRREQVVNGTRIYKVRVRREFKVSEKAVVALKHGRLLTAADSSMCGAKLDLGKVYVITGRVITLRARINLCGYARTWRKLTKKQRRGFRKGYSRGCGCRVRDCTGRKGKSCIKRKERNSCMWSSGCHVDDGICAPARSGRCVWTKNALLKQCLLDERAPVPSPPTERMPLPLTISRWSG